MPWKGVTVSEQRQRFLEDYKLNYYPVIELAERFSISRKTAHPGLTTRAGKVDRPVRGGGSERLSRALPSTGQLPVADGSGDRPGARRPTQGAPPLGPSKATRPDA